MISEMRYKGDVNRAPITVNLINELTEKAKVQGVQFNDDYIEAVTALTKKLSYEEKKTALFLFHKLQEQGSKR